MPALPEARDGARDERQVEVFQQMEAKHARKADGHVRIAGKIEIELEHIRGGRQPRAHQRKLGGLHGKSRVRQSRQVVGQEHLFGQTHDKAADALAKIVQRFPAGGDLVVKRLVAHDGPSDQLRKERYVQAHVHQTLLHPAIAAVYVDDVRNGLEREERYANGQNDLRHRQRKVEDPVHVFHQKAQVLEAREQAQVAHQAYHQPGLFVPPAPMRRAMNQLMTMESSITSTNQGSPQA